jgi:hypothetical protein
MYPGQCQDPNGDFAATADVYVGVPYTEYLAALINGANADVSCNVADITLIDNRVWHGGSSPRELPDNMFRVYNSPTYDTATPPAIVEDKRFVIDVTDETLGVNTSGLEYIVSVQYTMNGYGGEVFTLMIKFMVKFDC